MKFIFEKAYRHEVPFPAGGGFPAGLSEVIGSLTETLLPLQDLPSVDTFVLVSICVCGECCD